MEKLFFSKDNFKIIYGILQKKINDTHKYDINSKQEFNKELVNIMKTIYQQKGSFNIPANISNIDMSRYLSQKVINVANHYFVDSIKKKPEINTLDRDINMNMGTQLNNLPDRPQATNLMQQGNVNNSFEDRMKERINNDYVVKPTPTRINFTENSNTETSNQDISKRFEELTNDRLREYENTSTQFNDKSKNSQPPNNQNNNQNSDQSSNLYSQFSDNLTGTSQSNFSSQFTTISGQLPNKISENIPDKLTTQQNFINNPSNDEMQTLLEEQKSLQEKINNFQRGMATGQSQGMTNVEYNNNSVSNLSNQYNMPNNKEPVFTAPPQHNNQFFSENETGSKLLSSQFDSVTSQFNDNNNDRQNMSTNYSDILNNMDSSTPEKQFETQLQNVTSNDNQTENTFPSRAYDSSFPLENKVTIRSNETDNLELEIIKKNIDQQSKTIDNQNQKLEKLIQLYEKNDISKFYDTIMDIPKIIKEQNRQPLTIRTHNLIVSSRDRKLDNLKFDKYNFRIVFGAEGSTIVSGSAGGDSVYESTGLVNPTVQQVLKNVISIKLKRVIIPKPRLEEFFPEPYYFVCVDEFKSNIISTKTFNENIFCKIHFDKELSFNSAGNNTQGRSYMYYKNDDDDYTMFYPSPLGKLDRLTLKLLSSDGKSAASSFNDTDIVSESIFENNAGDITSNFYNGSFTKDSILVKGTDTETNTRIETILEHNDSGTVTHSLTLQDDITGTTNMINLTNQLEYIFEIKTQEPDPTNELRPNI